MHVINSISFPHSFSYFFFLSFVYFQINYVWFHRFLLLFDQFYCWCFLFYFSLHSLYLSVFISYWICFICIYNFSATFLNLVIVFWFYWMLSVFVFCFYVHQPSLKQFFKFFFRKFKYFHLFRVSYWESICSSVMYVSLVSYVSSCLLMISIHLKKKTETYFSLCRLALSRKTLYHADNPEMLGRPPGLIQWLSYCWNPQLG